MPSQELDLLLDTTAINKRLADRKDNPFRWRTGSFMVSKEASENVKNMEKKHACERFIKHFEQMGWTLQSKLQIWKGEPHAYDISRNAVLLDKEEWNVRGIFAINNPQPIGIELPPTSVRKDREQTTDLVTVLRGEGITTRNPRVRGEHTVVAPSYGDWKEKRRNGK